MVFRIVRSMDNEERDGRALILDVPVDESATDIFSSVTVLQPGLATARVVLRRSKSTEDLHDATAPPKMQRCTSWDMLSTTIHDLYSVTLMEAHDIMDLTLDTVALHDHTNRHYISESHVRAGRQGNSSPNDAADSSKSCFANEGVNEPLVMSACPCHFEQADCKVLEIESAPDEAFTFSAAKPRSYPFITGGYRPAPSSVAQCVASLFALHNETINIWTHISGTIMFAYLLLCLLATGHTAPFSDQVVTGLDMVVISAYVFSGLVCFALSALYHLLTSAQAHIVRIAEKADFAGILTLMLGSNFPMVFFGFSERTDLILFHTVMNIVAILLALAALRHDKVITIAHQSPVKRETCLKAS